MLTQVRSALFVAAILGFIAGFFATVYFWEPGRGDQPAPSVSPSAAAAHSTVTIDGHQITAAPGAALEYDVTTTKTGGLISENRQRRVTGNGPGLHTATEGGAAGFESAAPSASLGGEDPSTATGGTTGFTQTFKGGSKSSPLLWVGIVLILAGVFVIYRGVSNPLRARLIRPGAIAAALGIAFIAASMLPTVVWWVVAGIGLLGGGVYLYEAHKHEAARADSEVHDGLLGKFYQAVNLAGPAGAEVSKMLEGITTNQEGLHLQEARTKADV